MSGIVRKIIQTSLAPAAIGPYSQAVQVGSTMYISGQIGMEPATGDLVSGGVENQTWKALQNMGAILEAAGGSYNNVVKCTVLLSDMAHFAAVNDVYKQFFTDKFPARAAYQVAGLPKNALVEIEAIAEMGNIND